MLASLQHHKESSKALHAQERDKRHGMARYMAWFTSACTTRTPDHRAMPCRYSGLVHLSLMQKQQQQQRSGEGGG